MLAAGLLVLFVSESKGGKDVIMNEGSPTTPTDSIVQPSAAPAAQPEVGTKVKVDQVGYGTKHTKLAIVEGEYPAEASFALIDAVSGEQVFTGILTDPIQDEASQQVVRHADFSEFQTSGVYQIAVEGAGNSYPFEIGDNPYQAALATIMRSYTLQRAGVDIDDPITGLKQKAGHTQDAKAEIFFDDGVSHKGAVIDVSGGWYDAGDYGKYIPPAAVTVAQIMLAYDLNPGAFPMGQLKLPEGLQSLEKQQSMPDVLAEVKVELEWMLRMQRADGAVYHKVSGAEWTGFVTPDTDTQTRYVFGLTSYGTAQFVGAAALGARIYKPFDHEFSEMLLAAAEKAQSFLTANPSALFRQDPGQDNGSGGYGKTTDTEERLWALAELFRTTGDIKYSDTLTKQFDFLLKRSPQAVNWGNTQLLGQWAYYNAEKTEDQWKVMIRKAITSRADELIVQTEADGYLNTLKLTEYTWASVKTGAANGCLLMIANVMQPNETYEAAALEQLHHVFGRSATGYSYVTGIGSRFPVVPHHRINSSTGVLIPGLVVGGPNRYGGDPDLDRVKDKLAPAKAYLDVRGSYSSNEYAIDYNAPVVLLASFFIE
ncbi:endoglucanase [Paenibacillus castaneae]|uniref:glycoside hydrolase family 9 protein n=1 Tax=Paenibacillus castaneae TaxID=474957 RepID=UPI00141BF136|nr:glycoside hydrolase family 9 protein [Paenibacillus castaneae]NIK76209.1 endoglucanase [Paenibacillus castaneae]